MANQMFMASTERLTAVNFIESAKVLSLAFEERGERMMAGLIATDDVYRFNRRPRRVRFPILEVAVSVGLELGRLQSARYWVSFLKICR